MLNFIIGAKGSGKTAKAHSILGDCVRNGKKAILIVPKQFTFQSDKRILELLGPKDACEVEVLSFSRLATVVMQTYGGITQPVAKEGVRNILMSLAIENISDSLNVFARHKGEISLVRKMLETLDELKKEGLSVEEFEKGAKGIEDRIFSEKVRETALILRTYEAVISENYFDDADLLSFVAEKLRGSDFFCGKTVVLDGFAKFTKPEIEIMRTMFKTADEVYVTLCSDDITKKDELSPFALCNETARKLRLAAGNSSVETGKIILTERNASAFSDELFFLEKEIYKPVIHQWKNKPGSISISCASDVLRECDFVARKIKKLLRSEQFRCRDIAVCFRNGDGYENHLRQALKKYGVPVFEDKRQAIENQPLVSFVSSVLRICAAGFSSDYIFRLLKTGLSGLSAEEVSEIENYCFMWDISGSRWLSPWTENPDGLGEKLTDERKLRLDSLNSLRERIVTPLSELRKNLEAASGKEAMALLYYYLRDNGVDEALKEYAISLESQGLVELALEQEQVWELLMESIDEIATALCDVSVTNERLGELFELVIGTKSLGKLPDGFDEVIICTADRMLTNNLPVVFVMGLNSGVFPAAVGENGVFTRREKEFFKQNGIEIGEDVQAAVTAERFLLYNAFASASSQLHLSYSLSTTSGEKMMKGEGIDLAVQIFPLVEIFSGNEEKLIDLVESESSAFELLAKKWQDSDTFVSTLKEYFSSKESYRSRLSAIERATGKSDFAFENRKNAISLFGENMSFSASKLEDYGKCPFLFFCRYGLKAKPRIKAELDASHSGTVIHHVLEVLLKKYKGKEFLSLTDEMLKEEIGTILREYMQENMGSDETKTERFNYLYYRTGKILEFIMMRLRAEFEQSDFAPCDFELRIGKGAAVEPMVYELEQGSAQLHGFIDRVDCMELDGKKYVRIVDYKSGDKKFRLSDVLSGMNMQMLLYLVSIWRNGKGFYENIVPAGVLYFPARISPYASQRELDEQQRQTNRIATGQMNGLLVDEGDVISHMEKELRGLFIPAKIDKRKQTLQGEFISLSQLEKLAERMDETICEMGNSLHNGLVPARPAFGSYYTDVCSWCDYKDVCLKENPETRSVVKMKHEESIRKLMGGEADEKSMD